MDKFIELENLNAINGGGAIGALAGVVVGGTYGFAAGAVVAAHSGNVRDMFKTAWASAATCGGVGALLPEP